MLTHTADYMQPRSLGDGLLLRWSTANDARALASMEGMVFRDKPTDPPNAPLTKLIEEMLAGRHPLMDASGFALVEDTRKPEQRIVAATCLWRQTWVYEGIPLSMGRPELVATDPDYRNRGLVRAIFDLLHARSEAEGDIVQGITGIPYFYRQFGYEYALDLDGRGIVYTALIPLAKEGEPEPYTLRDATVEDLPMVRRLYDRQRASSMVSTPIEERWWRYQLQSWRTDETGESWRIQMIADVAGAAVGYLITPTLRWKTALPVWQLGVEPHVNLQAVMPPMLRALQAQGQQMRARMTIEPLSQLVFMFGSTHPVYDVLESLLHFKREPIYAWYVRVPNLLALIRHITPVLERRLVGSPVAGYSGEIKLDFYRGGLRMVFEKGHLVSAEDWRRPAWDANEEGGFPPLVFLQLLFGYRSLDDLRHAFPDVYVEDRAEVALKTLFPTKPSWAIALG